jgi:hypothetical protein
MNRNLKYLTVALTGGAVSLAVAIALDRFAPNKALTFITTGVAASLVSHIVLSLMVARKVNRVSKPSKQFGDFHHDLSHRKYPVYNRSKVTEKESPAAPKGKTKPKRKTPPKGTKPNPPTDAVNDASSLNTD